MAVKKVKKILHIYHYTDMHTGSPRSMIDLAEATDKCLYTPMIMTPREGEVSAKANRLGITTFFGHSTSLSGRNFFSFFKGLMWFFFFLRKNNVALIHYNGAGWRESSVLAAKFLNIPVVLHLRNHYSPEDVQGNFNFTIAKKIIIISESMRHIFQEYPDIAKKVVCIYNGIDVQKFAPAPVNLLCNFSDKSKYFVVGFVGQISHRKGLDLLIKAAPSLIADFPQVRFLIVGADGINEPGLTQSFLEELDQQGLSEYFEFLGKRQDIPEIMNFIDLLVVPSRKEPFGKVIVEAMACGKCVIASDVGGIPEIIDDGKNGFIFPSEDYMKLSEILRNAIADKELRESVAANGLSSSRSRFSTDALIGNVQNLYASVI